MLESLSYLVGKLTVGAISVYVFMSLFSALRMYFMHNQYAHIEFNPKKWSTFGTWAPKRLSLLKKLRWLALASLLIYAGLVIAFIISST